MTVHATPYPRWNTASFSATGATAASDLSVLGAHLRKCEGCNGRWFSIRCAVESIHSFMAPRFMTTLVAIAGVAIVAAVSL